MIAALISDLLPWAIGAVLAVLGLLGYGKVKKTEGRKANQRKQEEIDHETARDIRKRADDVKRVPDDQLKFRD